jgi:hypothetical protein
MLTVNTAAASTALTTLDAVKTELGITGTADDAWLQSQIDVASTLCCAYLGVVMATDGSMRLGRETLTETIRLNRGERRRRFDVRRRDLMLSRWPVVQVNSVTIDGTALLGDEYEVDGASGVLLRLGGGQPSHWVGNTVEVRYEAGWLLPGQPGRNLPNDIEDAAIGLVKVQWYSRTRNPLVKAESVPGVVDVQYRVGATGTNGALPPEVTAKLDPYRCPAIW